MRLISHAIADALLGEHIDVLEESGRLKPVGLVIREFSNSVMGVESAGARVAKGDLLLIREGSVGYLTSIESLEVDRVGHEALDLKTGDKFGAKVERTARVGSSVWRAEPLPRPAPEEVDATDASGREIDLDTSLEMRGSDHEGDVDAPESGP